jgi:hypothetical protein
MFRRLVIASTSVLCFPCLVSLSQAQDRRYLGKCFARSPPCDV